MKNWLGVFLLLTATLANAKEPDRLMTRDLMAGESFDDVFSFLDMKVFHDREGMKEVVSRIQQIDSNSSVYNDESKGISGAVFTEKDSQRIDKSISKVNIKHDIKGESLDEKLKKVEKDPFSVFQEIMLETNVPKTSKEQIEELNQVDEHAIPRMIEMATAGGPDVSNGNVSIIYDVE